jgi:glucose uptake protein
MAIAFPIVFGLAAVIGILLDLGRGVQDSPLLVFGGAALVVIAVVLVAFAYSAYLDAQRAAVKPTAPAGSRSKPPIQPAGITAARGVILSVLSGILMGLFHPLVELSREGESGVAAYGLGVLFGAGVFFSTILYVPFLCNFPLKGTPIELSSYFKGTRTHHMLGLLGGVIFMAGALSGFVVANAPARVQIGPALTYGLSQGAALLGALWGLTVWREFKGATGRVKMLLTVMILLLAAGLGMIAAGSK